MQHTLAILLLLLLAAAPAHASPCKFTQPDTAVNGIRLSDTESARRILGSAMKVKLPHEQDKDDKGADVSYPYRRFASKDGTQELKLYIHYGDVIDSYNEAEVGFAPRSGSNAPKLPFGDFSTQSGIQLNMSEQQLVSRLGSCFKRSVARGIVTLEYVIDDEKHPLLKRVNMPSYYALYIFEGGRLTRFKFGFEYP